MELGKGGGGGREDECCTLNFALSEIIHVPHKFCHFFQVNSVLEKELSSLRDILDQHNKSNVSKKLEQLNKVS